MGGTYFYEKRRIEQLRELMAQNRVDVFLIPPGPNFFYFSGFGTESMERLTLMIVTRNTVSIISPKLMEEQLEESSWVEDIRSWSDEENPYRMARTAISRAKPSLVAIDGTLPYFHYSGIFERLRVRKVLGDRMLSSLRMVKDSDEIEKISGAISKSESALRKTVDYISDEATERDVASRLNDSMLSEGLDGPAFQTIVAAGVNSSVPHHSPTDRKIKRYEPIVIDFGGRYRGYASDTTRTFFIDGASPRMEEVYEITRKAHETTVDQLTEESTYGDADRIAREVISSRGYGQRFIHRLGHGLGISVHEEPYLVPDNTLKMLENSVFTVEPGIYLPKEGGVRIEDTVQFKNGTCLPFNRFSHEMGLL